MIPIFEQIIKKHDDFLDKGVGKWKKEFTEKKKKVKAIVKTTVDYGEKDVPQNADVSDAYVTQLKEQGQASKTVLLGLTGKKN